MRRLIVGLAAAMLMLVYLGRVPADASWTKPWTSAETDLLYAQPGTAYWVGNTLTLSYGGYSGANASCGDYIPLPDDAIGISFGVSGTLQNSRASVTFDGWDSQGNFIRQLIVTNEINVAPDGQVDHRYGDLSDWSYGNVGTGLAEFSALAETVNGGVTSIAFPFTTDVWDAFYHRIYFMADGYQSDGTTLAGTTTYSDVSWILSDADATVPEPSALAVWSFLAFAGIGCGWWRKRRSL